MSWIGILQYVGSQSRLANAKQLPPQPPQPGNYLLAMPSPSNPMGAATTYLKNHGFVNNQAIVVNGFVSNGIIIFNAAQLPHPTFNAHETVAAVNEFISSLSPAGMMITANENNAEEPPSLEVIAATPETSIALKTDEKE